MTHPIQEGFIPFRGYKTWYRMVGSQEEAGKYPLLCLHGGPGFPHDYLEPLEALAGTGRQVVFYDQVGCGNSDIPQDTALYTVDLFVEEVGVIRNALGLGQVHLLGQSWGGILALEYALTQPAGLVSLVLADTGASLHQWAAEANRLVADLPLDVQEALECHFAAGTTDSEEYKAAYEVFLCKHVNRLDPAPECLKRGSDKPGDEVYQTMWGASEIHITGNLKDWDVTSRLEEIHVPTLVLCGRFDEATPNMAETMHRGIPGSEMVIFENSAHFPHLEETERYLQVVGGFIDRFETRSK